MYKKYPIIVIGIVLLLALGILFFQHAQTNSPGNVKKELPPIPSASAEIVTITGTVVCLPHRDQNGPQTMECAFGLKDNKGQFYGLHDSDPGFKNIATLPMGKRVAIQGKFTPKEDTKYQSIGTLEVISVSTTVQ